jgi:hypothetical protein
MPKPTKATPPSKPTEDDPVSKAARELDASFEAGDAMGDDDLDAMLGDDEGELDPDKDALAKVKYTGNAETDSKEEMSAALRAFKEQAKKESQAFSDNTDSEFWCCIVFQSRDQKEAFIKALALVADDGTYIDGVRAAKKLNIQLPPAEPRFYTEEEEKKMASLPAIRAKPAAKK